MAPRLETVFVAGLANRTTDLRTDAELLTRFVQQHDEAAFTTLFVRHVGAVRAVCRSWLRQQADIEDAIQATFFVFVRRAEAIRQPQTLGRWLCRVAENVARRLKQQKFAEPLVADPATIVDDYDDTTAIVAEEVTRLPEPYRRVVQLCYFAGQTTAEAARALGWPKGTVLTRLAWAKKRLHARLLSRGVTTAILVALASTTAPAIHPRWQSVTIQSALAWRAGTRPTASHVSQRTCQVTEGVIQTMMWNKIKMVAVGLLIAAFIGFGVGRWAIAGPTPATEQRREPIVDGPIVAGITKPAAITSKENATDQDAAKEAANPMVQGRRREAVIRVPVGTFVKEVDAAPYGGGRLTWTYDDDKVRGVLEGSAMGIDFEIHIDAEYSMSSNGTIYGLITGFKLAHLKFPVGGELGELGQLAGLWPLLEPLVAEVLTDLPFSYQFRMQGDRLTISNFRMLLAGPNPIGKVTGVMGLVEGGGDELVRILGMFQVISLIVEGNYTAEDKEKPALKKPAPFFKPRNKGNVQPLNLGNILGTKSSPRTTPLPKSNCAPHWPYDPNAADPLTPRVTALSGSPVGTRLGAMTGSANNGTPGQLVGGVVGGLQPSAPNAGTAAPMLTTPQMPHSR